MSEKDSQEKGEAIDDLILLSTVFSYIERYMTKIPYCTLALTAELWVQDVLYGNSQWIQEQFRMPFYIFRVLVNWCCENTEITCSRNWKGISVA